MVINKSGITIRIGVNTLREMGRATQGVKIIRLKDEDSIASVAKVSRFKEDEEVELDEEGNPIISEDLSEETIEENSDTKTSETEENNEEQNTENNEE